MFIRIMAKQMPILFNRELFLYTLRNLLVTKNIFFLFKLRLPKFVEKPNYRGISTKYTRRLILSVAVVF